jgi:hypothetical protein
MALARCGLEQQELGELRGLMSDEPVWYQIGPEGKPTDR